MPENKNELKIYILTGLTPEPVLRPYTKTTKVSEVINDIVQLYKLALDGKYKLEKKDDAESSLKPERPLVSYDIKNGDTLVFTDMGIAV